MSKEYGLYTAAGQLNLQKRRDRLNSPNVIRAFGDHNFLRNCLADLETEGYAVVFHRDRYIAEKEGQMIQVIP